MKKQWKGPVGRGEHHKNRGLSKQEGEQREGNSHNKKYRPQPEQPPIEGQQKEGDPHEQLE